MILEQIWTDNPARNFNYLVACKNTGEALAIDPVDFAKCLACAVRHGWQITQVANTHEHGDHIAGNAEIVAATGARLLAPENAKIENVDRRLKDDDVVHVGDSGQLKVIETPGHTMSHISLLVDTSTQAALFCGDALFNAGVGNCRSGDAEVLFHTIDNRIRPLPDDTLVYPGHDYLVNNLGFSVDREPDNRRASALLKKLSAGYDPSRPLMTTIGMEREINPFLRLDSKPLIARLRTSFPDLPERPDRQEVFLKLRELRDQW